MALLRHFSDEYRQNDKRMIRIVARTPIPPESPQASSETALGGRRSRLSRVAVETAVGGRDLLAATCHTPLPFRDGLGEGLSSSLESVCHCSLNIGAADVYHFSSSLRPFSLICVNLSRCTSGSVVLPALVFSMPLCHCLPASPPAGGGQEGGYFCYLPALLVFAALYKDTTLRIHIAHFFERRVSASVRARCSRRGFG